MKYCKKCGAEMHDDDLVCNVCRNECVDTNVDKEMIYAILSLILGVISLFVMAQFHIGLCFAIPAFILSIFGKKGKYKYFSIVGLGLSVVSFICGLIIIISYVSYT